MQSKREAVVRKRLYPEDVERLKELQLLSCLTKAQVLTLSLELALDRLHKNPEVFEQLLERRNNKAIKERARKLAAFQYSLSTKGMIEAQAANI